jgi:Glyoxalase-like domain
VFVPVGEHKTVKNRLHTDLAPHSSDDRDAEIAKLLVRGAGPVDVGQSADVGWIVLADPEGKLRNARSTDRFARRREVPVS